MKNKLITSVFTFFLFFSIFNVRVFGEELYGHRYFEYRINDGGVEIVNYLGSEEEVYVPNMIANFPVYKICSGAFTNCKSVITIHLPDTVTSIEENAFSNSINLDFNYNVSPDEEDNEYRIDMNDIGEPISTEEEPTIFDNSGSEHVIPEDNHIVDNNIVEQGIIDDDVEIENVSVEQKEESLSQIIDANRDDAVKYLSLSAVVVVGLLVVVIVIFVKVKNRKKH